MHHRRAGSVCLQEQQVQPRILPLRCRQRPGVAIQSGGYCIGDLTSGVSRTDGLGDRQSRTQCASATSSAARGRLIPGCTDRNRPRRPAPPAGWSVSCRHTDGLHSGAGAREVAHQQRQQVHRDRRDREYPGVTGGDRMKRAHRAFVVPQQSAAVRHARLDHPGECGTERGLAAALRASAPPPGPTW
jgi:hypothetical protein